MKTGYQNSQNEQNRTDWTAVIARCVAYLCLKQSEYADAPKLTQAKFLSKLGLPAVDGAGVMGSTANSLRVLASQAKKNKKKGAKKNGKGKRR